MGKNLENLTIPTLKKVRRIYCTSAYMGLDFYCIYALDEEPSKRGNETFDEQPRDNEIPVHSIEMPSGDKIEIDYVFSIPSRTEAEKYVDKLKNKYKKQGFEVKTSLGWCPPSSGEFTRVYFAPRKPVRDGTRKIIGYRPKP